MNFNCKNTKWMISSLKEQYTNCHLWWGFRIDIWFCALPMCAVHYISLHCFLLNTFKFYCLCLVKVSQNKTKITNFDNISINIKNQDKSGYNQIGKYILWYCTGLFLFLTWLDLKLGQQKWYFIWTSDTRYRSIPKVADSLQPHTEHYNKSNMSLMDHKIGYLQYLTFWPIIIQYIWKEAYTLVLVVDCSCFTTAQEQTQWSHSSLAHYLS